jgi:hypothetical protein
MSVKTMTNPLDAFRKMKGRSWDEIRTRGAQEFSARGEQIGFGGKLPTDEDFYKLLDSSVFGGAEPTAESIREKFYETAEFGFFPAFRQKENTIAAYRQHFGGEKESLITEKAEKIVNGKFDLLGFRDLDFDAPIDWHFEPIAGKRSPLKHWKQFDELDAEESGDKKIVWELNRHQHFFTLGAAFWLSGDERYVETFARHLEEWMQQNPPATGINWISSLEIAFRAMSWIWAFNFFKDSKSISPELFCRALKFLFLHGRHIEKYLSTYYSPNTHLTGEALGLYYLGTQLSFFNRAAHWRKLGEEILVGELERQISDDGVYFEQTTWYQRYTTDFYAHFMILRKLNGAETDTETAQKLEIRLQSSFDFLMYTTRPDGTSPIIGDDDGGRMLPLSSAEPDDFRSTLAIGAILFGRGDYKFVAGSVPEEIVWLLGAEGARAFEELPAETPARTSFAFKAGGYFVMRDGWAETDNFLLVDCGEIGALSGAHGHADTLSINAAMQGKTLFIDSGTYSYHESRETRNYFRSSLAHNTLVVDGVSSSRTADKFSWATRAEAALESWISEDRFDFFAGSHNGYQKNTEIGATHERSILFLKNDYWIMRDFVATGGEHDYKLNFHCAENVNPATEAAKNGGLCVGENGSENDSDWRLFTFGDNGGWRKSKSFVSKNYGSKTDSALLQFASNGIGGQEFFTFLMPAENSFAAPEVYETFLANGRAFVINYRDYLDLFVFTDDGEQIVRTEFFNTNFKFTWARIGAGDEMPEEFVMLGGSHFTFGDREVIKHPKMLDYAVARRFGSRLNVKTNENIFSVSIPQNKSRTLILGS